MAIEKPPFDALPLCKDGPRGNAWGLFGGNDQLGHLNLLTPATVVAASREIEDGTRVSTDWRLNRLGAPCFGRAPLQHAINNKAPRAVNDDILTFNTQVSSQWDGFRHYGFQKEQIYFGARRLDDLLSSDAIGTQVWVDHGGIVGRGVLLDYAAWAEAKGVNVDCFSTTPIPVSVLKEIAASQGTELRQGDILLLRTGWVRAYDKLTDDQCRALAAIPNPPAVGVESSEDTLRWIWEQGFAAVAGDQPGFEAWPCQNKDFWLHEWLLAGWGLPIGELFDLEKLGEACRKRKRWSFFFSSVPLKIPGGVASPPNGVAIF